MAPRDEVPSTRLTRSAILGGFVAEQTARYAGTAVANMARDPDQRSVALERRHLQALDQMLATLGTMKGPAMKVGQILSFVDLGLVPEEYRGRFQERLAELCMAAPPVSWRSMEPVLARSLGGPLAAHFSEFDTEPIGAASIGQVYRGRTHGGVDVAVKVQYPEMTVAARADVKNLAMLLRLAQPIVPSLDATRLAGELGTRLLEELDYASEAQHTKQMADAYRGHPFIRVPLPILELCRPDLLVTELVTGRTFGDLRGGDRGLRDFAGEALARFYLGSICRLGMFTGDPHPGNIVMQDDGRLGVFDFGSFRRMDQDSLGAVLAIVEAGLLGDTEAVLAGLTQEGILANPEAFGVELFAQYLRDCIGWFIEDDVVRLDQRTASEAIVLSVSRSGPYAEALAGQDLQVEWSMLIRTMVTTGALLGQLGAESNWNRIGREWVCGGPPSTLLGAAEAEFFAGRPG